MAILIAFNVALSDVSAQQQTVLLSVDRTEPILAVDPRNPSIVVAGANTNYDVPVNGAFPVAVFNSQNGGRSFSSSTIPTTTPYTTGADPKVSIDGNGTVFYSYLGEAPTYCAEGPGAVLMAHSTDHGRSFHGLTVVDRSPADDKPWSAVRTVPLGASHVYVAWTRFHDRGSDIWFSRSTDGGAHFSAATRLYASRDVNTGAEPVVGPGNRLYLAWARVADTGSTAPARTALLLRASTDDGAHFGPVRTISGPFPGVPHMSQPSALRNITFPSVVLGSHGMLAASWARVRVSHGGGRTDDDIMVATSTDGGTHWSSPRRVNDALRGDRFMPALTWLGKNRFAVIFYDRRAGGGGLRVYAASLDAAHQIRVSPNVRVDSGFSPVSDIYYLAPGSTCFTPGRFFGDYIGLSGCGQQLCAVWSDTALRQVNRTDVWFRRFPIPALRALAPRRATSADSRTPPVLRP